MRICFQNVGIREVGGDMERDRDRGRDIVFTFRKNMFLTCSVFDIFLIMVVMIYGSVTLGGTSALVGGGAAACERKTAMWRELV